MRVLIATDGNTDVPQTAEIAARLADGDGSVTVYTAIVVPRQLLAELRAAYGEPAPAAAVDQDAEYVSARPASPTISAQWPGDDVMIQRYVAQKTEQRTGPMAEALRARGIEPTIVGREAEDPTRAILAAIDEFSADIVCIGTHGEGRFEGLLGSVGSKVARRAPVSVVLVRPKAAPGS